jgi:hypothetical protein
MTEMDTQHHHKCAHYKPKANKQSQRVADKKTRQQNLPRHFMQVGILS